MVFWGWLAQYSSKYKSVQRREERLAFLEISKNSKHMPRVHTSKARTDRYNRGKKIEDPKTKRGYRIDKSQPADENDTLFCKKGETYYYWSPYRSSKVFSKTYPKRSQLTGSPYYAALYDLEDSIQEFTADSFDDLESFVEDIKSQIEDIRDEQEEKRENMPESLQESPTGELLQERYENLDEYYNELDSLEMEDDEDEGSWIATYREDELEGLDGDDKEFREQELEAEAKEKWDERYEEAVNEAVDAFKEIEITIS